MWVQAEADKRDEESLAAQRYYRKGAANVLARHCIFLALLASNAKGMSSNGRVASMPDGTKNVILFQCDEMDGRIVDPRHPISRVTRMPTLEAMAASGVNFVNTYCNTPICAPSRASMFTGRRTSSLEAWSNVKSLTADISEWPATKPDPNCAKLAGLGAERCVQLGKRQNVSSTLNSAMAALGYEVKLLGKMDTGGGTTMSPPGTEGVGYHDTGYWESGKNVTTYFPGCLLHSCAMGANISKPAFAPLEGHNSWINTKEATFGQKDWKIVDDCVKFLRSRKPGDPPFFLYCSVVNPHPPYTSNVTWEKFVNMEELEASLDWTEKTYINRSTMHPADVYTMEAEGTPEEFNRSLARDLALAYHGACAMVDHMVGIVRTALQESVAASDTYLVFTSDHGEMHLEHRLVQKMSMYEASARVPLIVEGPGVQPGVMVADFVTLVDLFPTLLDMAGATKLPDAGLQGYSLAPFLGISPLRHFEEQRPDFAISEYTAEEANTPQFMFRRGDFKYIAYGREPPYQGYAPQLFNVTADPLEVFDLAQVPAMSSIVAELDARLMAVVNYQAVAKTLNVENRENIRRWMAGYNETTWQSMARAAYGGGDDRDVDKLLRWLHEAGEFAPLSASLSLYPPIVPVMESLAGVTYV